MTGEFPKKTPQAVSTLTAVPAITAIPASTPSPPVNQSHAQAINMRLTYMQKVIIAVGVSVAAALLVMFLMYAVHILVLCFAGVLFAVFLSAPSDLLTAHARLKRSYALAAVLVALVVVVLGGGFLMGRTVVLQTQQLNATVMPALKQFEERLGTILPGGAMESPTTAPFLSPGETMPAATTNPATTVSTTQHWVVEPINRLRAAATEFLMSESFVSSAGGVAGGVVSSTLGIIGDIVVILGVGLFFAIHPRLYSQGVVRLFPLPRRERVASILSQVGAQLQWWFVGQICSMVSIGLLTFIGLTMLGAPMALTLGIFAGLMNFIPNFGPIIAAVPAVLVTFAPHNGQPDFSFSAAGWVMGLYIVVQLLEGWVITPFFQQRAVALPPALIIMSQVVFALLLGPMGLILATPMLAAVMVLVRMIYVEDLLGDRAGGGTLAKESN